MPHLLLLLHLCRAGQRGAAAGGAPSVGRRVAVRSRVLLLAGLGVGLLSGCEREVRRFRDRPPAGASAAIALSDLQAGPATSRRQRGPYDDEAWSVAEGQRYFTWFNCNGCHATGGGGIGPPLMDSTWIYGSEPENIFASIVEGRPNGMPSFRGRIPDQQVWQLVGYVRSLSGQLRKDVKPGRPDAINARTPPLATPPQHPVDRR